MEYGKYRIDIIRKNGIDLYSIVDFTDLRIVDTLNGIGSWNVSSASEEKSPFQPGDFVRIMRNDHCIFCGCLTSFENEYDAEKHAWYWSASGKSMNQLLKWKYIFPPASQFTHDLTEREMKLWNTGPANIAKMIFDNVRGENEDKRCGCPGFSIVSNCADLTSGTYRDQTIYYRFDNVYDAAMSLANSISVAVFPTWIRKGDGYKVLYAVVPPEHAESRVIFNSALNQISSFRHNYVCPEYTDVIMSYNSEDGPTAYDPEQGPDDPIWQYVASQYIMGAQQWRTDGQTREIFVKPKKEDFKTGDDYYAYTKSQLQRICDDVAFGMYANTEYYEVDANISSSPYVYGYDWNFDTNPNQGFATDYKLGDYIGFIVDGTRYTGRLTRIEFSVSYDNETITPTIGGIGKGIFSGVISDLGKLNRAQNNADTTEV